MFYYNSFQKLRYLQKTAFVKSDLELEHIQRLVDEKQLDEKLKQMNESAATTTATDNEEYGAMPEMIDDFIRNYFANMGLYKTLGSFQVISFKRFSFQTEHIYSTCILDSQLFFVPIFSIGIRSRSRDITENR